MRVWLMIFLLLLLPACALAENAEAPAGVTEGLYAFHPDAVIEDVAFLADVQGEARYFVLFREDGKRALNAYRLVGGVWECDVDMHGVPQIEAESVAVYVAPEGGRYSDLWECEAYQRLYPEGPAITVYTGTGEHVLESATYVWGDEGPCLAQYTFSPNAQVDIVGDDLVFYNISWGLSGRTRVHRSWIWYAVDFETLPRQVDEVRIFGDEAPDIPDYGADNALTVQDVSLTPGKRWSVYLGPGKQYGRAGNGRAVVSTNGWVQVFGEYDGWLFIQYAITAEQYRFGWISDSALAKGEQAAPVPFTWNDRCTLADSEELTDDPLNSKTPLLTLTMQDEILRLAELGDSWSYVRVERNGQVWFGFIASWLLGHG